MTPANSAPLHCVFYFEDYKCVLGIPNFSSCIWLDVDDNQKTKNYAINIYVDRDEELEFGRASKMYHETIITNAIFQTIIKQHYQQLLKLSVFA